MTYVPPPGHENVPVARVSATKTDVDAPLPVTFQEYTFTVADVSTPGKPSVSMLYGEDATPPPEHRLEVVV